MLGEGIFFHSFPLSRLKKENLRLDLLEKILIEAVLPGNQIDLVCKVIYVLLKGHIETDFQKEVSQNNQRLVLCLLVNRG